MVGGEFLAHCKPGVRIINVARGEAARAMGLGGQLGNWAPLGGDLADFR